MAKVISVDVGTGSVRAACVDTNGTILSIAVESITTWNPKPEFYQQSSSEIWHKTCKAVKEAIHGINPDDIVGIGFDATCSLVVVNNDLNPVSVSEAGETEQNVIVWMDHRAISEAEAINKTQHSVLQNVGGTISPEMETPKLKWIKNHLPDTYKNAAFFFDLADFLVCKSTGTNVRSKCTTVCKWAYMPNGWQKSYFDQIGLDDIDFERIGTCVVDVGTPVGSGITAEAGRDLGLNPGTAVSAALIDAHAGGIGLLGENLFETMAVICGTSSCHMSLTRESVLVKGVWGPYQDAMVPGLSLSEGGQSSTGSLLDHIIETHARGAELIELSKNLGHSVYVLLNERLKRLAGTETLDFLTHDMHIVPDFHGNRSPLADPSIKGMVSGLSLDGSLDNLAVQYLAAVQALAHGTKAIIDAVNEARTGPKIASMVMTGGLSKNPVYVQAHANICQCSVTLPAESEAVLLGSAISAAVASNVHPSFSEAMAVMCNAGQVFHPDESTFDFHMRKNRVLVKMYKDQKEYREIIGSQWL